MILTLKIWRYWWFENVFDGGDVDDVFDDNDNNCDDDDDGVVDNIGLMMLIIMNMTIFY